MVSLRGSAKAQQVIQQLASEGGITRILEVTKIKFNEYSPMETISQFKRLILPFLRTITQKDVLLSLTLEASKGTIYAFLFGIGGRRGIAFFAMLAEVLKAMVLLETTDDEAFSLATSTILTALLQIIDCNQTAYILVDLQELTQGIASFIENQGGPSNGTLLQQVAHRQLAKIRTRLDFGATVEPVNDASDPSIQPPTFQFGTDWPGRLSPDGVRHDNDHENICHISIMPTADEIRANRLEYLPVADTSKLHITGVKGLLDRQFRLLREDTVGQLRDCVRSVLENLTVPGTQLAGTKTLQNSTRFLIYQGVNLSDVIFEKRKGLQVTAEFDQPSPVRSTPNLELRKKWWSETKQLQVDSLLCLVDSMGMCVFFSVSHREGISLSQTNEDPSSETSLMAPALKHDNAQRLWSPSQVISNAGDTEVVRNLWNDQRRGTITLQLIDMNEQGVAEVLGRRHMENNVRQVLVEFPGVLLPSFRPTLEALKGMSKRGEVPFAHLIAPVQPVEDVEIIPPAYATQPGFAFNLRPIANGVSMPLRISTPFDTDSLKLHSTLDDAQCTAVVNALTRSLALIQGPPGTGKSYVAVQIVKVLLACRQEADLGPIICVYVWLHLDIPEANLSHRCYTNHALDQFLEHLLSDGVGQIIRLGGGSKSKILEPLNLRNVSVNTEETKVERTSGWEARRSVAEAGKDVAELLHNLKRSDHPSVIRRLLEAEYPHHYDELFREADDAGFTIVRNRRRDPLSEWLQGDYRAPGAMTTVRERKQLYTGSLYHMSGSERRTLHGNWVASIRDSLTVQLQEAVARYTSSKEKLQQSRRALDLRCLQEAHLIGITTSGLARNVDLLQRLAPKVVIFEEAGEILEAHTVTALLPTIEHAILIGDHEQLRPQIQNFDLSMENAKGRKYSLDVSLFERLLRPQESGVTLLYDTLEVQRRMDPSISELVRSTLYPNLKDHEIVQSYPPVTGIRKRLFWLDHRRPEGRSDPTQPLQTSHWNDWEVETLAALVTHLVRQGVYRSEGIAVLTPYVRQLQKIRSLLSSTFDIIIGERDEEELGKHELLEAFNNVENPEGPTLKMLNPLAQKTTLSQRLRIATVDNFQGEEADVVVVSMVRSNIEKRCGFLRTTNRINVLLR